MPVCEEVKSDCKEALVFFILGRLGEYTGGSSTDSRKIDQFKKKKFERHAR